MSTAYILSAEARFPIWAWAVRMSAFFCVPKSRGPTMAINPTRMIKTIISSKRVKPLRVFLFMVVFLSNLLGVIHGLAVRAMVLIWGLIWGLVVIAVIRSRSSSRTQAAKLRRSQT